MNRIAMSLLPFVAAACAAAQPPAPSASVTESGRVARFVAGPGDRPQGVLLRNGTLVTFSPGLAQRLPASLPKRAMLQVVGERYSYAGNQTVQARTVTIAGVSYNDDGPAAGDPNLAGRPGVGVGPDGPPPPPAPGAMPPMPPPPSPQAGVPPPPPSPPPARRGGPPAPMAAGAPPQPPAAPGPPTPASAPGRVSAPPPPAADGAATPPTPPTDGAPAMQPPVPPAPLQ
jgi:hypothetical protein